MQFNCLCVEFGVRQPSKCQQSHFVLLTGLILKHMYRHIKFPLSLKNVNHLWLSLWHRQVLIFMSTPCSGNWSIVQDSSKVKSKIAKTILKQYIIAIQCILPRWLSLFSFVCSSDSDPNSINPQLKKIQHQWPISRRVVRLSKVS